MLEIQIQIEMKIAMEFTSTVNHYEYA